MKTLFSDEVLSFENSGFEGLSYAGIWYHFLQC